MRTGLSLIMVSAIIGIITVRLDSFTEDAIIHLLAISGIGFVSVIVMLN